MEFLELSFTITLIGVIVMLLITDIFFNADVPTHTAYVLSAIVITKDFNISVPYQLAIGLLIWCCFIVFHHSVWKKAVEKIRTKIQFISFKNEEKPAKYGKIKSIDGEQFISVNGQLFKFESLDGQRKIPGKTYKIEKEEVGRLFI